MLYYFRQCCNNIIQFVKELGNNIDVLKDRLTSVEQEYESFAKNYMKQKYPKALDIARRRIYDGSNIVCTTLSSCARLLELNRGRIDCCIVDEATQSKEAEILIPLMLGVTKLILVGDPQQLPAVIISQHAKHLECGQSLFQRIKKVFNHNPENPIRMLNVQHRMHPEISVFPNNEFYQGELKDSESCILRKDLSKLLPYHVFNLNLKYNQESIQNTNKEEIGCVEKLIEAIDSIVTRKSHSQRLTVGIITPYNSQKAALVKMVDSCR
ncbi:dna2/nam7 helicase family [Holotrichia oblita]|uniref:Dna2/nam7 helicase family n=1 Tax=Holotrichia oblita TaxID=644536 RepID=A0ACB9TV25_HOLOL|nr:dna2/nam7 helicase family [Holotrichia oblita]